MQIIVIDIKPYTSKELALLYNVSKTTFNKELALFKTELGPRLGHRWSIHQVELIMIHLGRPYQIREDEL